MHVIRRHEYELKPWKNGLGETREIISQTLGPNLAWRLSRAVVDGDGPFSDFAGLERILTVISGGGMRLAGRDADYDARPFTPVRFPGGERILGRCDTVPIENFNVIFDPALVEANVEVATGSAISQICGGSETITVLHVLEGNVVCDNDLVLVAQDTGVCSGIVSGLQAGSNVRCVIVSLAYC